MLCELETAFPTVAKTIAFKNHVYHNIFSDRLVCVFNQLPGVSSLINLASIYSNHVSFMQMELAYGQRAALTAKGYHTLVPDQSTLVAGDLF